MKGAQVPFDLIDRAAELVFARLNPVRVLFCHLMVESVDVRVDVRVYFRGHPLVEPIDGRRDITSRFRGHDRIAGGFPQQRNGKYGNHHAKDGAFGRAGQSASWTIKPT